MYCYLEGGAWPTCLASGIQPQSGSMPKFSHDVWLARRFDDGLFQTYKVAQALETELLPAKAALLAEDSGEFVREASISVFRSDKGVSVRRRARLYSRDARQSLG